MSTVEPETESEMVTEPSKRGRRGTVAAVVLAVLLVASAALTGWLYVNQYRPDQQTDKAVADTVVKAASDGTVALLSYAPESLDKDFATAKAHLTGDFLNYYNQFTTQIVTPAATEKKVKTSAAVVRAAMSELHPQSATVLVFINQSTTSADKADPVFTASSVKVGLQKIDDAWLISNFDPV